MSSNYKDLIKSSTKEAVNFTKKNAAKYNVVADLVAAQDLCKTKDARAMIEAQSAPLLKALQKERLAFEKRLPAFWKATKGEKIPKEAQKELDAVLKKSADETRSKSGHKWVLEGVLITSYSFSG